LAAGAEATNIAAELDRLARRQLLPYARPDERIDPIDTTGFRKRAASGYRDIAGTPQRQRRRQVRGDIYVLVPPACAGKKVEGRGTRGTLPALRSDRVSTARFDDC